MKVTISALRCTVLTVLAATPAALALALIYREKLGFFPSFYFVSILCLLSAGAWVVLSEARRVRLIRRRWFVLAIAIVLSGFIVFLPSVLGQRETGDWFEFVQMALFFSVTPVFIEKVLYVWHRGEAPDQGS